MNASTLHTRPDSTLVLPVTVALVADEAAWSELMAAAPFPHLPQSFAYGQGKRANGWIVQRAIFQRGERILAFATILEKHVLGIRIVARVNRGPVFIDPDPTPSDIVAVYAALGHRWRGALLIAPALPSGEDSDAMLRQAGFRLRHELSWTSGRIDLRPSEDQLWAGFASTFRNRVRQSQKHDAQLRVSDDAATYDWMIERHLQNMTEKGFSAADAVLLQAMRATAPGDVLVFQMLHGGEPVAGMSVVRFGHCAEYHIGWFGPQGRQFNAGNFLMWEIIRELKARGVSSFDVGGLREGDGYTRFKRTMRPTEYRLAGEWMRFGLFGGTT